MDSASSPDDKGVGSSTGLSLREQLRIKAQQKLRSKPSSPPSHTAAVTTADLLARSDKSDDEELASLTLGRRTKRQAALKRPATYSIDPTDDTTRLKRHPRDLQVPLAAPSSTLFKKPKTVESLLREKQRKAKAGTDADGLSRAEAIALNMERERLEMLGISPSGPASGSDANVKVSDPSFRAKTKEDRSREQLTVKALSPTIPSFLWSSHSESGDTDEEDGCSSNKADIEEEAKRMAASLAAAQVDEQTKERTMGILRQERTNSKAKNRGPLAFYRPGRTYPPRLEAYDIANPLYLKREQSFALNAASTTSPTDFAFSDEAWAVMAPHILLSGTLPPSLKLNRRQLGQIIVWSALSFMLDREVMQSRLRLGLFQSLVSNWRRSHYRDKLEKEVPGALSDIVWWIPHLLNDLGVSENVIEECFPDHSDATDGICPLVTQSKLQRDAASSPPVGQDASNKSRLKKTKLYLTQTERDDILINLARIVEIIMAVACDVASDFVAKHLSLLAGYVASMSIALAASTNLTLHESVTCAVRAVFTAASKAGSKICSELQAQVSDRVLSALGTDDIGIRARLVKVLPAEIDKVNAIRRWIAWITLTQHLAHTVPEKRAGIRGTPQDVVPSSDPVEALENTESSRDKPYWRRVRFEPLSLDLGLLVKAIDCRDAKSPFYISLSASGGDASGPDFEKLVAATSLVAAALTDLGLHLCTLAPNRSGSAPTNRTQHSRALQLALAPYASLVPELEPSRVKLVKTIIDSLNNVNSRIRDGVGDVVWRSMAKDALQRLGLVLEYQLHSFDPPSSHLNSFIK